MTSRLLTTSYLLFNVYSHSPPVFFALAYAPETYSFPWHQARRAGCKHRQD